MKREPEDVRVQKTDVGAKSRKKVRYLAETKVLSPLENMGRTRHLSLTIYQIYLLNPPTANAEDRATSKLSRFRHLWLSGRHLLFWIPSPEPLPRKRQQL